MFSKLITVVTLAILAASASAQTYTGYNVASSEARQTIQMQQGVVLDILPLEIEKAADPQARTAGSIVGGLVGVALASGGGGLNWQKAGALGAIGALAGDFAGRKMSESKVQAVQVVVRTGDGRTFAVAQEDGGPGLAVGDSVYIMYGQTTRVVKSNQPLPQAAASAAAVGVPAASGYPIQKALFKDEAPFNPRPLFAGR